MSANFEKLVLEKLDRLEANQQKLETNQQRLEDNQQKLEANQQKFETNQQKFGDSQSDIKTQLNNLIFELKETQDVVKYNTSRIICLENTFKNKIDALFDARSINNKKHEEYENSFNHLNSKIFNHDIRISTLEDNLKLTKEA